MTKVKQPTFAETRVVVLAKPGDLLLIGNLGEFDAEDADQLNRALDKLNIRAIFFSRDIDLDFVPSQFLLKQVLEREEEMEGQDAEALGGPAAVEQGEPGDATQGGEQDPEAGRTEQSSPGIGDAVPDPGTADHRGHGRYCD